MGKSQKKRAARRHNPVRVPDSHLPKGLDAAEATSSRSADVLPIIQKLSSVDAQERTWACSAVSNLIQNDPSTRRLLQGKNVVGALINRLSDSVPEVTVEAAGALRNLCIDGGFDICAEMYNKNILAPLRAFIPKISSALDQLVTSPASAPPNTSELVFGLAESVITLIWCLSETSNKALNAINDIHLVPFLMGFLEHRSVLPARTVAAAAQCLYVLTDDNPSAIEEIRANSTYVACLLATARSSNNPTSPNSKKKVSQKEKETQELAPERLLSTRLLTVGVLRNLGSIPAPSTTSTIDVDRNVVLPLILPVLSSVQLSEASNRVLDLIEIEVQEPKVDKPSLKNTPRSDHKSPAARELEKIEASLRNVQLALEILTGVCATLPDPEPVAEDDEEEEEEEEEEAGDDEMDAEGDEDNNEANNGDDVEMDTDASNSQPKTAITPAPTPTLLPSIIDPLLSLIQPTSLSFPPSSSTNTSTGSNTARAHPPTTSALGAIHVCAFECLNNAALALAISSEGAESESTKVRGDAETGRRVWNALWSALGVVGLEGGLGQEKRKEIWEVSVGVMWGIGGIWKGSIEPVEEQVKLLMQLCDASEDVQTKVKCIGALECLAQFPSAVDANRVISSYILEKASTPPSQTPNHHHPAEVILQSASAIIDIFSDERLPSDINFRQGGYLQVLSARTLDSVKRAVKSVDRKKEGGRELKARGEEVLENLREFMKYRRGLRF